ncbi:MAG: glycosyltransferase [Xenococcaceae cyanobacterium]
MRFHGYYILSTHPLIVSFIGDDLFLGKAEQTLPEWFRPKYVLEHVTWWSATPKRMVKYKLRQIRHGFKGRTHHLVVNTLDEESARKRFLIRGNHFNHNFYINEHLLKPLEQPKNYDAVYTARLDPVKRHWLAKNIERLFIATFGGDGNLHTFCPELQHAEFNQAFLPHTELVKKYNQAYAGLCLSAIEGPMIASTEYLLCGIPVVSTPSKGGRDEFFNSQNSLVVPPESSAVAQAVEHWKKLQPDPQVIREGILQKFENLRRGYCKYIAELIYKDSGEKKDPEELMEKYFASPEGIYSRFVHKQDLAKINLEDFSV